MKKLLATEKSSAATILRVFLAIIVFPHGAQKLLGWFGGYGFEGTMHYFTQTVGLPWIGGFLVIVLEFFGSLALLIGMGTRILSLLFLILAISIVLSSHIQFGFFQNWLGNQKGEGYEYFLFWIAIAWALIIKGAGNYSVDSFLVKENK
jgi:putative oxidoreductase